MIKKTIKYVDYNDVEREEDHYFHISKAELTDMQMSIAGGMAEKLKTIVNAKDTVALYAAFKDLIKRSYGVKSDDGKRFIKNEEVFKEFEESEAYSEFIMELVSDENKAIEFVNGLFPKDLANKLENKQ